MNATTNITTVGLAAGITTIVFWLLGYFAPDFLHAAPDGAEAAVTGVITALVCYFVPHRPATTPPKESA